VWLKSGKRRRLPPRRQGVLQLKVQLLAMNKISTTKPAALRFLAKQAPMWVMEVVVCCEIRKESKGKKQKRCQARQKKKRGGGRSQKGPGRRYLRSL